MKGIRYERYLKVRRHRVFGFGRGGFCCGDLGGSVLVAAWIGSRLRSGFEMLSVCFIAAHAVWTLVAPPVFGERF